MKLDEIAQTLRDEAARYLLAASHLDGINATITIGESLAESQPQPRGKLIGGKLVRVEAEHRGTKRRRWSAIARHNMSLAQKRRWRALKKAA